MDIQDGWLTTARRVISPHHDTRPENVTPRLLVIHNISLPPGQFGGPYIDQLFQGTLDPDAHPFFAEIQALRVSAHCLIRRTRKLCSMCHLMHGPGMRVFPAIRGRKSVMIFPSVLSWKGQIHNHSPMNSTGYWLL